MIRTCHTPSADNLDENKNPGIVWNVSVAVMSEAQGGLNGVHAGRIGVNTESVITSCENLSEISPVFYVQSWDFVQNKIQKIVRYQIAAYIDSY